MRTTIITLLVICFWLLATRAVPASRGADSADLLTNGAARPTLPRVATGRDNLLVVKTDGSLWSMGSNLHGAVGDGTTNNRPHLVRLGADNDWADAACGNRFALALKTDGTLWAWGENGNGQLGDGTMQDRSRPVRVGQENNWIRIAAGPSYSLALKSDGTAWAWGHSDFSAWGHGSTMILPTRLDVGNDYIAIAATPQHALLLTRKGISQIWELETLRPRPPSAVTAPPPRPHDELATAMRASLSSSPLQPVWNQPYVFRATEFMPPMTMDSMGWEIGVGEDCNIWLQGHIYPGEQSDQGWAAPSPGPTLDYLRMIRIGTDHVVAVKSDGSLWAWGTNYAGQIGNGTTNASAVAVRIGQANDWVWAAAGGAYSAGLKDDGSFWMWGRRIGGESKPLAWLRTVIATYHLPIQLSPPHAADLAPRKIADLGAIANGKFKPQAAPKAGVKGLP